MTINGRVLHNRSKLRVSWRSELFELTLVEPYSSTTLRIAGHWQNTTDPIDGTISVSDIIEVMNSREQEDLL